MKIQPAVRLRRKEIRDEAKRILLGKVLFHPYFPHDIYINVSGIKEWLNQPHKLVNENIWNECWVHSISDNILDINEEQDL